MSSVPAVYEALLEIGTTALAGISDAQVTLVGSTMLKEIVLLIGAIEGTRSAGSQNRVRTTTRNIPFGTSQDEFTVEMFISVSRPGADMMSVVTEADAIFELVRDAIEASDDLDINGVYEALPTGGFEFTPAADANGRYVTVKFGVDVTARD